MSAIYILHENQEWTSMADMVLYALRRAIRLNGVTGLCITKLDVLDGLDSVRLCTAYRQGETACDHPPVGAEEM